jgi:hypothetical protein
VSALEAAAAVDDLYRRAVEAPAEIDDAVLLEWLDEASEMLGPVVPKDDGRVLRKVVRSARKLAAYWVENDRSLPDWRNGVDEALGARAWESQLDLVMNGLGRDPDPMLFDEAKARFRAARFEEWMEGVSYEEWVEGG